MNNLQGIIVSFPRNKSKYLDRSLKYARALGLIENGDQFTVISNRTPDNLGKLYHLLKALYDSHKLKNVDMAINKEMLTKSEIFEIKETLDCYTKSRRSKDIKNHCFAYYHDQDGSFMLGDESSEAMLIPCKRTFDKMHASVMTKESFFDLGRKHRCDICPHFTMEKPQKVISDAYGNILGPKTHTYIE